MKKFEFDKALIVSSTAPDDTTVYWAMPDISSGKITHIFEYNDEGQ